MSKRWKRMVCGNEAYVREVIGTKPVARSRLCHEIVGNTKPTLEKLWREAMISTKSISN